MLLENNTGLFKNPTVGISMLMRAARESSPLLKNDMFASCGHWIFAKVLLSLFPCSLSSQYMQVYLGTAFIVMQGYTCQKKLFFKISPLSQKLISLGYFMLYLITLNIYCAQKLWQYTFKCSCAYFPVNTDKITLLF